MVEPIGTVRFGGMPLPAHDFGFDPTYGYDLSRLSWFTGAWLQLASWAAYAAGCAVLLVRCSHRAGWGPGHRLAVGEANLFTDNLSFGELAAGADEDGTYRGY